MGTHCGHDQTLLQIHNLAILCWPIFVSHALSRVISGGGVALTGWKQEGRALSEKGVAPDIVLFGEFLIVYSYSLFDIS